MLDPSRAMCPSSRSWRRSLWICRSETPSFAPRAFAAMDGSAVMRLSALLGLWLAEGAPWLGTQCGRGEGRRRVGDCRLPAMTRALPCTSGRDRSLWRRASSRFSEVGSSAVHARKIIFVVGSLCGGHSLGSRRKVTPRGGKLADGFEGLLASAGGSMDDMCLSMS